VKEQRVKWGFAIPGLLSLFVHEDSRVPVSGLDKIPPRDWPPVAATFHSFHLMVWLGVLFVVMTLLALFFYWRGTLFRKRWLLWSFVLAVPLPFAANQLGWVLAEVGRQPWVVYGLLRTSDALSKAVVASQVLTSIIMFILIYVLLFAVWVFVLDNKIRTGPEEIDTTRATTARGAILDVAGQRAGMGGASLTEPENDDKKAKEWPPWI
jgi:cytochrome bd ubiquinol oxidase subunit I